MPSPASDGMMVAVLRGMTLRLHAGLHRWNDVTRPRSTTVVKPDGRVPPSRRKV
jgi:hypothetical protein